MNKNQSEETREKILALIESEYESDAAFEREMGLASKTVNNWRRGRSSSYMKMLPKLADGFEVSIGELLDVPITHDSSDLSEDEIELLTLYRKCTILPAKQKLALSKTLLSVINLYLNSAPENKKGTKR